MVSISHALILIITLDLKTFKHRLSLRDVFFSLFSTLKGQRDSGCTSFSSMDVWEPIGSRSVQTLGPRDLDLFGSGTNVMSFTTVGPSLSFFWGGGMKFGKVDELPALVDFEEIHQHPTSLKSCSSVLGVKKQLRLGFVGLETCTSLASLLLSCTFFDLFSLQSVTCDPAWSMWTSHADEQMLGRAEMTNVRLSFTHPVYSCKPCNQKASKQPRLVCFPW